MESSLKYWFCRHLQCNAQIRCCNLLVQTPVSPSVSKSCTSEVNQVSRVKSENSQYFFYVTLFLCICKRQQICSMIFSNFSIGINFNLQFDINERDRMQVKSGSFSWTKVPARLTNLFWTQDLIY